MSVLVITRSDDNAATARVIEALRRLGGEAIRFDTDLYPQHTRLSSAVSPSGSQRVLITPEGRFPLEEVHALYYRRFSAGNRLPAELGDLREPSLTESRRTVYGTIASLDVFQLDSLRSVRHCDHKELQLERARAHGLEIPRTLFTNDPAEARRFHEALGGRVVTKMQTMFAVHREEQEHVVFTSRVTQDALGDLDGLQWCPMTFQEELEKALELRVTVVGRQVFAASIDSQRLAKTQLDWRRDGVALLKDWQPYTLPTEVEHGLLGVMEDFGLNYGAADIIVTPDGRHVFLEVNAAGEWFWLEEAPGFPIAEALAKVLLGEAPRVGQLTARTGAS